MKEDKGDSQTTKKKLFLEGEEPIEDKNGLRRTSLPYPQNEVSYHLIKYISCEGKYSVVYGYQFRLLEELRFGVETYPHHRLSIPYFLLQSLIYTSIKVQEGNPQQLAHHGLIRIIIEDALHNLIIPIQWDIFRDMQTDEDIKALTYDISPIVSEKDEEETETNGEEAKKDEEEIDEDEEEETKKEGGDETKEDVKEDTDKQNEDLKGEEEGKGIGKKGNGKEGQKTRRSHLGYLENPLRERQQLPSLPLAPISKKKEKDRGNPLYTSKQRKVQG